MTGRENTKTPETPSPRDSTHLRHHFLREQMAPSGEHPTTTSQTQLFFTPEGQRRQKNIVLFNATWITTEAIAAAGAPPPPRPSTQSYLLTYPAVCLFLRVTRPPRPPIEQQAIKQEKQRADQPDSQTSELPRWNAHVWLTLLLLVASVAQRGMLGT